MKFHCLMPIRDEADIIAQCLHHALEWADRIVVFDTRSVDDTWEIVLDIAGKEKRVIPLRKEAVYYNENSVRGWLFDQARREMREGDWFVRGDADEFHHITPIDFVKTRLRRHETVVWRQYYDFRFCAADAAAWESGQETLADRQRPIAERRHWYVAHGYSEPRMCRYRSSMRWPATVSFPYNAGYVARERIPIRHYSHRDPVQMDRRCRLRAAMMANAENRGNWTKPEEHPWSEVDWRQFIEPDDRPDFRYWDPTLALPEVDHREHLKTGMARVAQRLIHATALPLLDRRRPGWQEKDYPQPIPPEVTAQLREILGG